MEHGAWSMENNGITNTEHTNTEHFFLLCYLFPPSFPPSRPPVPHQFLPSLPHLALRVGQVKPPEPPRGGAHRLRGPAMTCHDMPWHAMACARRRAQAAAGGRRWAGGRYQYVRHLFVGVLTTNKYVRHSFVFSSAVRACRRGAGKLMHARTRTVAQFR
jgi:hypothetical protein